MTKNVAKYGIISLIGIFLIFQFIPVGDYCTGLLNFLNSLFIGGLLLLIVVVLAIRNLFRIYKKKGKFDFIPLLLAIFFGILWYFLVGQTDKKFWTEESLVGILEIEGTPKSGTLELFENGSFGASYHHADYSCTFQGDYVIDGDKLELKRVELPELTDNVFTTVYILNRNDSVLKPIKKGFKEIEIIKLTE